MKFASKVIDSNTHNKVVIKDNEVLVAVTKVRDDLNIESKRPVRCIKKDQKTIYSPRMLYRDAQGNIYYTVKTSRFSLSIGEQKQAEKAIKKIKKMRKRGKKK